MNRAAKTAIYYLENTGRSGPQLRELCKCLGLNVFQADQGWQVKYGDALVGTITSNKFDKLALAENLEQLARQMPEIAPETHKVFCRLYRRRVAIHEIGHVMAVRRIGFPISRVSLDDSDVKGIVELKDQNAFRDMKYEDPRIGSVQNYFAAGAAAEKVYFGDYGILGASQDRQEVNHREIMKVQAIENRVLPHDEDFFDKYVARVEPFIQNNKKEIEAISQVLSERGALDAKQVETIIRNRGL